MSFDNYQLWNTHTTLGVLRETEPVTNYWLNLCFPNAMTFDDEFIDFSKIPSQGRKLAPFVAPMADGRAIYSEGSSVARFKPAYVKPSDPVTPSRALVKRPNELLSAAPMSPAARYDAIKADIIQAHRDAIERTWEWMAAKAVIDGKVVIEGDDYPKVTVDFGRAAGNTVVLGNGAKWGDPGISVLDSLQTLIDTVYAAPFGGGVNRITMGTDAWAKARKDPDLLKQLDLTTRGSEADFKTGLLPSGEVTFVGTFGAGIPIFVYKDYYTVAGSATPFMSPKDIVLTGPGVQGYRCFGAIQDIGARFQALPIFIRNYITPGDTQIEQIVSQSAPLMVPLNPNQTLKATVVA